MHLGYIRFGGGGAARGLGGQSEVAQAMGAVGKGGTGRERQKRVGILAAPLAGNENVSNDKGTGGETWDLGFLEQ